MAELAPSRSRRSATLVVSGLLAATITLLEPAKSAVSNWSEVGIGFEELLARLVVPFVAVYFAIAALAVPLNALAPRRGIPLLVAVYVALWAQGNLFVWDYGAFDGSPIDWSEHSGKGLLEFGFWIATLVLALTRPAWVRRRALPIAAVVLALQLAALAGQVRDHAPFSRPTDSETQRTDGPASTDPSLVQSVSRFSSELNVIIVVLDSMQSDFFAEAIRDPELRDSMPPGFTYYRNAISLYMATEYSVPSILSSRALPNYVSTRKWRNAHLDQTLPATLTRHGFDAVLTTVVSGQYERFGAWKWRRVFGGSIAEARSENTAWREDVSNLFALGLFRLSPHFLKFMVYDDGSWQMRRLYPPDERSGRDPRIHYETRLDLAIFDQLLASASVEGTVPHFRFLHFYGAHRPYSVDHQCRYAGPMKFERKRVIAMTHCELSRLFAFLQKLDRIGVYDKSLVFVLGDHGGDEHVDESVASPPLPEVTTPPRFPPNLSDLRLKNPWRGAPLFLVKPIGDRQPLRVSDLPVSLCDVPNSVIDALSIEGDFECESIFSIQDPRKTPRIHYRYPNLAERRELGLVRGGGLPFQKYRVEGHSWRPDSWIPVDEGTE